VLTGYLRHVFKKEIEVKILDMQLGYKNAKDVLSEVRSWQADILGLSMEMGTYEVAKEILSGLYSPGFLPGKKPICVLGNTIPTFATAQIAQQYKDAVLVVGEGEEALEGIVRVYKKLPTKTIAEIKRSLQAENVPNLAFMAQDGSVLIETGKKQFDLSKACLPARDTLPGIMAKGGCVTIETSRGCPHGACSFCAVKCRFWR
jgi:radical SAM superfamily enzyme YgiQ (UPF0313 family)